MKKILAWTLGPAAALAAAYIAIVELWAAPKAQKAFESQIAALTRSSPLELISQHSKRGFLSTERAAQFRLRPGLLDEAPFDLPEQIRALLGDPFTVRLKERYLPWRDGAFALAEATGKAELSEKAAQTAKKLFGEGDPIEITDIVNLDESGRARIATIPFDYEELSGVKIKWGGSALTVDFSADFKRRLYAFSAPSFRVDLADKASFAFEGMTIDRQIRDAQPLGLGESKAAFKSVDASWQGAQSRRLSFSDAIEWLTGFKIGRMFDPGVEIDAGHASMRDVSFSTFVRGDADLVDMGAHLAIGAFNLGQSPYAPIDVDVEAKRIDPASLLRIKAAASRLAAGRGGLGFGPQEWRSEILDIARSDGFDLFRKDPEIEIKNFLVTTPHGKLTAKGTLGFKGLEREDLGSFEKMVGKLGIDVQYQISETLASSILENRINMIFEAGADIDPEARQEMRRTFSAMAKNAVGNLESQGYARREGDMLLGDVTLRDGEFKINGKTPEQWGALRSQAAGPDEEGNRLIEEQEEGSGAEDVSEREDEGESGEAENESPNDGAKAGEAAGETRGLGPDSGPDTGPAPGEPGGRPNAQENAKPGSGKPADGKAGDGKADNRKAQAKPKTPGANGREAASAGKPSGAPAQAGDPARAGAGAPSAKSKEDGARAAAPKTNRAKDQPQSQAQDAKAGRGNGNGAKEQEQANKTGKDNGRGNAKNNGQDGKMGKREPQSEAGAADAKDAAGKTSAKPEAPAAGSARRSDAPDMEKTQGEPARGEFEEGEPARPAKPDARRRSPVLLAA